MTRYRHLITDANRKWWTLGAMCFALFMIMLDNTVVNVALPSIERDLGASLSSLEWTINGYTLAFAVLLATGGRLGDIFGRRLTFLIGVTLFSISSATAGLAPDTTCARRQPRRPGDRRRADDAGDAVDRHQRLPAAERGKAIGTWAGVSALALAIGPVLGGFLTEDVSWRAIFFINLPVGLGAVLATACSRCASRATRRSGARSTTSASPPSPAALTALVLALIEGNSWGWGSASILGLLAGSVVLLAAFVLVELRGQGADGRVPPVRQPQLRRLEHGRADRHLRDAGAVLLPRPLHAEHPRLLAAPGRASGSCRRP